jgi:hypothetical protein
MSAKSMSSLRQHPVVYACIFVKHGAPLFPKQERVLELYRSRRRSRCHKCPVLTVVVLAYVEREDYGGGRATHAAKLPYYFKL